MNSISNAQNQVREWMKLAEQECPGSPVIPSDKIQTLRATLIREESAELFTAMYDDNMVEVADALGDLLYVVLGAAVAYGIELEPIWQEIHRSNMSKFIDGHRREDGKWIKGPSYSPANLAPIIEAQQPANP